MLPWSRPYLCREIYLGLASPLLQSLPDPCPNRTTGTPDRARSSESQAQVLVSWVSHEMVMDIHAFDHPKHFSRR